jgi:proteasome lid subunit RPN8/RPN11
MNLKQEIMRAHGEVARGTPGAKARLERLQARYRTSGATIERPGGSATLIEPGGVTSLRPRRVKQQAQIERDAAKRPFGYSYREAEFREHFVRYSVGLEPKVRDAILGEIKRAHRRAGEEVEVAGWLGARYRPREDSDWIRVVHATRSGSDARGSRTSVTLCDPFDALVEMRREGFHLCGDWHCHCIGGSELPSDQDVRAWCGTMDGLGRSAYVSLVVSPGEETGWWTPRFSAWVAGRYGLPSRPVVGRARIEC